MDCSEVERVHPIRATREGVTVTSSTNLWTYPPDEGLETDLRGFSVEARDGAVGEVESSTHEVGCSYVVVRSGRIFHHCVLVPAAAVEELDLDAETVFLSLTRAEVDHAPHFDAVRANDASYRQAIEDYYLAQPELAALVESPTAYRRPRPV
jgi:hypothetical protein